MFGSRKGAIAISWFFVHFIALIQNLIDKCRLEKIERQNEKFKETMEEKMKNFKNQIV